MMIGFLKNRKYELAQGTRLYLAKLSFFFHLAQQGTPGLEKGKRIFYIAPSFTYGPSYKNSSINTNFFPSETSSEQAINIIRARSKYYMVVGFARLNLLENLLTTYVGTGLGCFRVAGFALFLQDEDTIG